MPQLNITIPVYNEKTRLANCIPELHKFLTNNNFNSYEIVIANNGSTDETQVVAEGIASKYPNIKAVWIPQKGRGGAIKKVWSESEADILSYMDVDLSSDLEYFPALINSINGYDIAIGSRLLPDSIVVRSCKREIVARCYLCLVKSMLHTKLSDMQCGFKAIKREVAQKLMPLIADTGWFFDTELLILAEHLGYKIRELPIKWKENSDSRVHILKTAIEDIRGIIRLRKRLKSLPNTFEQARE